MANFTMTQFHDCTVEPIFKDSPKSRTKVAERGVVLGEDFISMETRRERFQKRCPFIRVDSPQNGFSSGIYFTVRVTLFGFLSSDLFYLD